MLNSVYSMRCKNARLAWNCAKFPIILVFLGLLLFAVFILLLIEKIYRKRSIVAFLYSCTLFYGEKVIESIGFLDSGNLAIKNNLPVCFLSPDLFYELIGETYFQDGGQVCDKMSIRTVNGERHVLLYCGEIALEKSKQERKKQVYFALSQNSISQEYRLLLNARFFDEQGEKPLWKLKNWLKKF